MHPKDPTLHLGLALVLALLIVGMMPPGSSSNFSTAVRPLADSTSDPPPFFGFLSKEYHLPGYDPLTAYVDNGPKFQYPTLSSSYGQPVGIYYVDNSSNLVMLSLSTGLVVPIAPVVPLYQYGYTAMLDNEFYIEYGYDTALFFGTLHPSGTNYTIELVDLGTGARLIWNTSDPVAGANQQPEYIGNDTVLVFSANDTIQAFNLSSRTTWAAGSLEFFEANNVYWIPQMRQLVNVQAEGSSGDKIQVLGGTSGPEPSFSSIQTFAWGSGVPVNGVNGVGFNLSYISARPAIALAMLEGSVSPHSIYNVVIPYANASLGPNNTLTSAGMNTSGHCGDSGTPGESGMVLQRYVYTTDYFFCVYWNTVTTPTNVYDPWNGSKVTTNITPFNDGSCDNQCFEGTYAPSFAYLLDFNATSTLMGGETHPPYSVVYDYRNASEQYPAAVPDPPSDVAVWATPGSTTELNVSWTPAPGTLTDQEVYVYNGSTCSGLAAQTDPVSPSAGGTYLVEGLLSGSPYSVEVQEFNASGGSPVSACAGTTTNSLLASPTALAATSTTPTSVTLMWSPPAGTVDNNTVFVGYPTLASPYCADAAAESAGAGTSFMVQDLAPNRAYCFAVGAWENGVAGNVSAFINASTEPGEVTNLTISDAYPSGAVNLSWSLPVGGVVNVSVGSGTSCSGLDMFDSVSHGGGLSNYGWGTALDGHGTECLGVIAWFGSGPGQLATDIVNPPPGPPAIKAVQATLSGVVVTWKNPAGPVSNVTLFWNDSSVGLGCNGDLLTYHTVSVGPNDSYDLQGLVASDQYCVAVSAWNSTGVGPSSPSISFTPADFPASPKFVSTRMGETSVALNWANPEAPSGIVNDTVYIGESCDHWTYVQSMGSVFTSFDYTVLSEGAAYCFAVQAWSEAGGSLLAYENNTTLPGPPTGLTGYSPVSDILQLRWTNPTNSGNLTNLSVAWEPGSCGPAYQEVSVGLVTAYDLTGLTRDTTYCISVSAWTRGGPDMSASLNVSTSDFSVETPQNLTVTGATSESVSLAWTLPPGPVTNVTVRFGTSCAQLDSTDSTHGSVSAVTVRGLTPSRRYCFAVVAWNASAPSNLSNTVMVETTPGPSGTGIWAAHEAWVIGLSGAGAALVLATGVWLRRRRRSASRNLGFPPRKNG